jgi:hypothetical protein
MVRFSLILVLLALLPHPCQSRDKSRQRSIKCKTAAIAPQCYWTRGRLSFYNGTPAILQQLPTVARGHKS